ncbi:MAG: menaquinol-cytochrome c reductase cytochrome b subunit, partial [Actinobacteria bacterium]|nr:menaquinol-cytochrome c reductase cytochrome b subunit [Actinomycetota bacterium]
PAAAAPAGAGSGGGAYFEDLSSKTGVPAHLLERSARRRSQLTGEAMPGDGGAAAPAAAAAAAGAPAAAATATAVAPAPILGTGPEGHTHRLLTVVKAGSIQQTKASPVDKVHTWPHLLVFEFVALLAVTAVLIIFSALVRAPLLELADPNLTPNPSKAPWYFLGLQELLTMFHPMVAGVLLPGYGLLALAAAPYVDKNPATNPSDRKFAVSLFTVFLVSSSILVIIGSFFRGQGFNFTFPWRDGVFFDL